MKTIFEKIIDGELPSEKLYEDERIIAIKDKFPKAPIHILIITKKVIPNIHSLEGDDFSLMADVFRVAKKLALDLGLDQSGYRILINNGAGAGQIVSHLHFHLIGGRQLGPIG